MSVGKMGLTIEEAAESTGIGRNTMRKHASKTAQLPIAVAKENAESTMGKRERTNETKHGREPEKTGNKKEKGR